MYRGCKQNNQSQFESSSIICAKTHQSMRISAAELLEHVHNLVAGLYRLKVLRLQVVLLNAFNSKAEICCARDCLAPYLRKREAFRLLNYAMSLRLWLIEIHHVARLRYALRGMLFLSGRIRIDLNHLLVHVLKIGEFLFIKKFIAYQFPLSSPF